MTTASPALIEAVRRIDTCGPEDLARMAAHEYDEEVAVPPAGSPGRQFLRTIAESLSRWAEREGRFPDDDEADEVFAGVWDTGGVGGSQAAQAFVDLGLHYSHHAAEASSASVADLKGVLDRVAEKLVITLTGEFGPAV